VDILTALYFHSMRIDPDDMHWSERDRFILSKGHAAAALCPALAERGFFPHNLLDTFNQLDSLLGVHPDMLKIPGVDMSAGSLGHGLSIGLGMALASRIQKLDYRVYVLMGDGELNEGSVWEAVMSASHFEVDSLVAIVDKNHLQIGGHTEEVMKLEPLADRWRAFGWAVREIDGHDLEALVDTLSTIPFESAKPSVIMARTVKGKGLPFVENRPDSHYRMVDEEMARDALATLGISE